MPFQIIRNDITRVHADAIVNSANPRPVCGSGTDYAIYKAAGMDDLLAERKKIGRIDAGEAAVTDAYALPARYIIHTVGPKWRGGFLREFEKLASCYRKSLLLAEKLKCESIAFPLISTGVYGFPKDRALQIALGVFREFLKESDMDIILVVFDRTSFALSADLVDGVRQFIDERYVDQRRMEYSGAASERNDRSAAFYRRADRSQEDVCMSMPLFRDSEQSSEDEAPGFPADWSLEDPAFPPAAAAYPAKQSLSDVMKHIGENFQERLLRLIDERELTDAQVYKKANIDRKLFSKIRCNPAYKPGKKTVVALAVALELNLDETVDLLGRAELALSPGNKFDLIVEYCIVNHIYDVYEINALLFEYDQPMLGCY